LSDPIRIVTLYPHELEASGERGNVTALRTRLERAGHAVEVAQHEVGEAFPDAVDLVVIGNGPLSAVRQVHADLLAITPQLRTLAESGVAFFAVGAGLEILGREIRLADGSVLAGAGIFPVVARRGVPRQVGYIVVDAAAGQLVGFEDNASRWDVDAGVDTLGTVSSGGGNGDGREGVVVGASIGTQTKGPILPLNPLLTDRILRSVLGRRSLEYTVGDGHRELDRLAAKAREVIVANVKSVFTTI
jgi:CobQ-like glutamine amidotransferase family enzyme